MAARCTWVVAWSLTIACSLAGCELIADFDSGESEAPTVRPKPIPALDGAAALMPDGSLRDGAVVVDAQDAGPDAAVEDRLQGMDAGR